MMARLAESPELLEAIKQKALVNLRVQDKKSKKAEFRPGPVIVDFESQCENLRALQLTYS